MFRLKRRADYPPARQQQEEWMNAMSNLSNALSLRQTGFWRGTVAAVMLVLGTCQIGAAQTGNPYSAAIVVNTQAVTNYELGQRIRLLQLFRTPGDIDKTARDGLVDDRLRMAAASEFGIRPSDEDILAGMEEFAARANLGRDEFVAILTGAGVSEASFRDFIRAGVAWRGLVRSRFGPRAQVTEAEVDRAVALSEQGSTAVALISEIVLPAETPTAAIRANRLAEQIRTTVTSIDGFSSFASRYSVAASRNVGGRLAQPIPIASLPPAVAAQISTLAPGGVSQPVPVPNGLAIYQLREIREGAVASENTQSVEFARYALTGGASEAAKVAAKVDTCDDLYGVALKQPPERLIIENLPLNEVPADIAVILANLDPGESSAALRRGDQQVFVMLCGRTAVLSDQVDREGIRNRLISQRVSSFANGYLAALRADAIIREP
ncbi:MAG: peptidyl-prolyl cis-trans isomerase SurA [Paracoccaceae bacterium]|jgi:peptidyl-prolyl cis-trans isomerase SurA